jgi:hypothetical protein
MGDNATAHLNLNQLDCCVSNSHCGPVDAALQTRFGINNGIDGFDGDGPVYFLVNHSHQMQICVLLFSPLTKGVWLYRIKIRDAP